MRYVHRCGRDDGRSLLCGGGDELGDAWWTQGSAGDGCSVLILTCSHRRPPYLDVFSRGWRTKRLRYRDGAPRNLLGVAPYGGRAMALEGKGRSRWEGSMGMGANAQSFQRWRRQWRGLPRSQSRVFRRTRRWFRIGGAYLV